MREVGILEAKTNLSALVDALESKGEEVVITKHGRPVAWLVKPSSEPRPRKLSGAELVEKFRALRERIARENPEIANLTWEEIKAEMHK